MTEILVVLYGFHGTEKRIDIAGRRSGLLGWRFLRR